MSHNNKQSLVISMMRLQLQKLGSTLQHGIVDASKFDYKG
jgi:hypothetical protein